MLAEMLCQLKVAEHLASPIGQDPMITISYAGPHEQNLSGSIPSCSLLHGKQKLSKHSAGTAGQFTLAEPVSESEAHLQCQLDYASSLQWQKHLAMPHRHTDLGKM